MDVRMFDLFSYNGVIIIMPWENKIVFIFVQKCTEYKERVQKDTLKDERKVSLTHTSKHQKFILLNYFNMDHFSHLQKAALTRMGSISSEQEGISNR